MCIMEWSFAEYQVFVMFSSAFYSPNILVYNYALRNETKFLDDEPRPKLCTILNI